MNRQTPGILAVIASLMLATASHAAVMTYVGAEFNVDPTTNDATIGWHSTGNAKLLDIDGDNALGSDGWLMAGNGNGGLNNPARFLPSYITPYVRNGGNTSALQGFANTAYYSGVIDAPGTGALNLNPASEAQGASIHTSNANAGDLFIFTISDASLLLNETLRIGLLFDTPNTTGSGTQVFTLTQTVGGSSSASSPALAHANNGLDVAFFDITGVANGDKFVIRADSTLRTHLTGITWDSAVPEPASLALLAVGGLFIARRRKA